MIEAIDRFEQSVEVFARQIMSNPHLSESQLSNEWNKKCMDFHSRKIDNIVLEENNPFSYSFSKNQFLNHVEIEFPTDYDTPHNIYFNGILASRYFYPADFFSVGEFTTPLLRNKVFCKNGLKLVKQSDYRPSLYFIKDPVAHNSMLLYLLLFVRLRKTLSLLAEEGEVYGALAETICGNHDVLKYLSGCFRGYYSNPLNLNSLFNSLTKKEIENLIKLTNQTDVFKNKFLNRFLEGKLNNINYLKMFELTCGTEFDDIISRKLLLNAHPFVHIWNVNFNILPRLFYNSDVARRYHNIYSPISSQLNNSLYHLSSVAQPSAYFSLKETLLSAFQPDWKRMSIFKEDGIYRLYIGLFWNQENKKSCIVRVKHTKKIICASSETIFTKEFSL